MKNVSNTIYGKKLRRNFTLRYHFCSELFLLNRKMAKLNLRSLFSSHFLTVEVKVNKGTFELVHFQALDGEMQLVFP
jgi:hypothetical protein